MALDTATSTYLRETVEAYAELVFEIAEEDLSDPAKARTVLDVYTGFVKAYIAPIVQGWRKDIEYYLNSYEVRPKDGVCDEFKNIYFLGVAISREMKQVGLADIAKYQQIAMLKLLDFRLFDDVNIARPQLTARVRRAIESGALENDFGRFGLYLVYRCLFNFAKDQQTGSATSLEVRPLFCED